MTLLEYTFVFFVLLGSKILLGAVAVYMLLPDEPSCATCDAELLPLVPPPGAAWLLGALRLERRWCMECRRETLARRSAARRLPRRTALPVTERRLG
jgi:hypothetical protein